MGAATTATRSPSPRMRAGKDGEVAMSFGAAHAPQAPHRLIGQREQGAAGLGRGAQGVGQSAQMSART